MGDERKAKGRRKMRRRLSALALPFLNRGMGDEGRQHFPFTVLIFRS
jgi:hypothetical protein